MEITGNLKDGKIPVNQIYSNTELTLIQVTEDKLRLALAEHLGKMQSKSEWQVPAGILITIILVLVTSDFKDFFLPKATWHAFFLLGALICTVWLVRAARKAFAVTTIDDLVSAIKKDVNLNR